METQKINDVTADAAFRSAIIPGTFVRIEYLTDLNEFIKADVLLKRQFERDGVDYIELNTGEQIRLDRIVSVSGQLSPNFPGYINYSCNC